MKKLLILILLLPTTIYAVPSITSTSVIDNNIIINGSGFGQGPNIELFETFEDPTANAGDIIPLSGADIGDWDDNSNTLTYSTNAHSGRFSAYSSPNVQYILKFTPIQEIFISYWVRVPNGEIFPGGLSPYEFGTRSSWKFIWLIDQDYYGGSSDVCLPTHIGEGTIFLAGNDFKLWWAGIQYSNDKWWSWNSWNRFSFWLKANELDPLRDGLAIFQTLSEEFGVKERIYHTPIFDADGSVPKQYQMITLPGWMIGDGNPRYDDVYIATGPNAAARVEIANNIDYNLATKVAIQPSQTWTNNNIVIFNTKGEFTTSDKKYLFVWDSTGTRNQIGYELSNSSRKNPNPPTHIR